MVILLVWRDLLSTDSLQYGYKARTSTVQCTWLASEVVQQMLRNGINPIVTVLDCSKAFDKCKFSLLFKRLQEKGLPSAVIQVLAYIYVNQYGWVKWGDARSSTMTLKDGTTWYNSVPPFLGSLRGPPIEAFEKAGSWSTYWWSLHGCIMLC